MPLIATPITQPTTTTISETIANIASLPKSVSVDGMTATNQSVQDLIAADRYTKSRTTGKRFGRPLKFLPPGAV